MKVLQLTQLTLVLQDFHIVKPWKTQHPKWEIYSVTNEGIAINPVNIGLQCT